MLFLVSYITNAAKRSLSFVFLFCMSLYIIMLCLYLPATSRASDTLSVGNAIIAAGDTESISIYLYNNEFPVAGFTLRLELDNSLYASIINVERGQDIENFEYFVFRVNTGSCRVTAMANWPGGGNPSPLIQGRHEIARILVGVSSNAPADCSGSLLFKSDSLPPDRDNSIADDTGYINEVPVLLGGRIVKATPSGTGDIEEFLSGDIELCQNYPNPFNANTNLTFRLGRDGGNANLAIYDSLGRRAKGYFGSGLMAGEQRYLGWSERG